MGSVTPEVKKIAHSDDARGTRPWLSTLLTTAAACVVMFLLTTAAVAFVDIRDGGPDARNAAKQARLNGDNLCEFAVAVSDVLVALVDKESVTPEQRDALDRMESVAAECRSVPE